MAEWTREKLDALADAHANTWAPNDQKAIRTALWHFTNAILVAQENLLDPPECPTGHGARGGWSYEQRFPGRYKHCPDCGALLGGSQ